MMIGKKIDESTASRLERERERSAYREATKKCGSREKKTAVSKEFGIVEVKGRVMQKRFFFLRMVGFRFGGALEWGVGTFLREFS